MTDRPHTTEAEFGAALRRRITELGCQESPQAAVTSIVRAAEAAGIRPSLTLDEDGYLTARWILDNQRIVLNVTLEADEIIVYVYDRRQSKFASYETRPFGDEDLAVALTETVATYARLDMTVPATGI